jgi:membrane-associated phospholipid phosphatase
MPISVTACYALLALAVQLGILDVVDAALRHASRPGDVWGPSQMRAGLIVQKLRPDHLVVPLLLAAAMLSLLRRSLRPFAVMAVVGVPVIILTLGTKFAMARPDPHATPFGHGGSFPSGHTISVIVTFGLVVLLLRPGTRWGWILPALVGCLMGWALVVVAMHWATDVVGGGLLAAAALGSARATGLGRWASERQMNRPEPSRD